MVEGYEERTTITKSDPAYYLGSGDGPGIIITLFILRGNNYDEWARAIRRSLKARRKLGFVDGTIKKPPDSEKLEEFESVHSMLVSWISNTLYNSIRSTLGDYDDSSVLWTHLHNRFYVVSGTRICQLKSSLGECKQGKNQTIAAFYGRLNKIWDELVTYMEVPKCKCGLCACDIASQVMALREEDYLHYFVIGLDGMYRSIREQLLARYKLPSLDSAYQTIVNDERLRMGENSSSKDMDVVMAFKTQSDYRGNMNNRDTRCGHCHQRGHPTEGCYQLIGFPEWWGDRSRGDTSGKWFSYDNYLPYRTI